MPTPSEEIEKTGKFIMRLAEDPSRGDVEAVQAILDQLKGVRDNPFFPTMYQRLVPVHYDSTTKLASQRARNRLAEATHLYSEGVRTG